MVSDPNLPLLSTVKGVNSEDSAVEIAEETDMIYIQKSKYPFQRDPGRRLGCNSSSWVCAAPNMGRPNILFRSWPPWAATGLIIGKTVPKQLVTRREPLLPQTTEHGFFLLFWTDLFSYPLHGLQKVPKWA
jgi:hypothetical protein